MRRDLTRDELIELVSRITEAIGTEEEMEADIALYEANCRHPDGPDLIFWPHGFPHYDSKPDPTVEEIVDKAMTYQPVILPLSEPDGS